MCGKITSQQIPAEIEATAKRAYGMVIEAYTHSPDIWEDHEWLELARGQIACAACGYDDEPHMAIAVAELVLEDGEQ